MTLDCKHNVRELLQGAGPCAIRAEVRLRNGQPNWWCHTHGLAARAPDGAALGACAGAWLDPIVDEMQLDVDLAEGEVAIWGVVPPAISHGPQPEEAGRVHVHRRNTANAPKDIDRSYDLVRVTVGSKTLVIEGMAAVAYSIAELSSKVMTVLLCPHCGGSHIDEKMFATRDHIKHQCNSCGRNFRARVGPSVGNPLAAAHQELGLPGGQPSVPAVQELEIASLDYTSLALWPSNAAILTTMSRPEESGIHVHAWTEAGLQIDDTFSKVVLDGQELPVSAMRMLSVQRALTTRDRVRNLPCIGCGEPLTSPGEGWMTPVTAHVCVACGAVTRTRRKLFLNPLAEK